MTATAIRLGPGAARALAGGGHGVVEIVLHRGGYVRLGRARWLLLAPERAPLGPLSVLVRGLTPLRAGAAVVHAGAALEVGDQRIDLRKLSADGPVGPPPRRLGWRAALEAALAECPPPSAELAAGLAALRSGAAELAAGLAECPPPPAELAAGLAMLRGGAAELAAGLAMLRSGAVGGLAGLGPGLTPAGDDVLAGYAAWRHADGAPVSLPGDRCSPLGLAYLRCAERGELPEAASRALHAIRAGDAQLAMQRGRALRAWGATSGSAILWGMAAAAGTRA